MNSNYLQYICILYHVYIPQYFGGVVAWRLEKQGCWFKPYVDQLEIQYE